MFFRARLPRPNRWTAILLLLLGLGMSTAGTGNSAPFGAPQTLWIGALLSLTGEWSTLGKASQAALQIAAREINQENASFGNPLRVQVIVRDTKLVPDQALLELRRLAAAGVRTVIGPQSSAEARVLKPVADARGILLISQGSTASSLATANDNLFRFCPSDQHEADAMAALLSADGIRGIVPLWRNDAGNQGLHDSVKHDFEAGGGTVTEGFRYEPDTTDFGPAVAAASAQVQQLQQSLGSERVAVYLASFDETVAIFNLAHSNPTLAGVKWFGADGVALSRTLLGDATAADFAARVGFPTPSFGLDETARAIWEPLSQQIQAQVGFAPDAFALAAYDALSVAVQAHEKSRGSLVPAVRRRALAKCAGRYYGATGWCLLDSAGDRQIGNYDFWAIRLTPGGPQWVKVGSFTNGTLIR